jgi:hypothetical protein
MTRVFAKFGLIGRTYWSKSYIQGEWWTINLRLVNKEFDRYLVSPGIQSLSITGHHNLAGGEHMWQIKISKSYGYSNLLSLVRRRDSIPFSGVRNSRITRSLLSASFSGQILEQILEFSPFLLSSEGLRVSNKWKTSHAYRRERARQKLNVQTGM